MPERICETNMLNAVKSQKGHHVLSGLTSMYNAKFIFEEF